MQISEKDLTWKLILKFMIIGTWPLIVIGAVLALGVLFPTVMNVVAVTFVLMIVAATIGLFLFIIGMATWLVFQKREKSYGQD